jgi:hypothetical protein
MLDWLDRIPILGVPGVPGVQPQKYAIHGGTPDDSFGVPCVPEHRLGTPGTPAGTPASHAKPLQNMGEHRERPEHRQNEQESLSRLTAWRTGLQSLHPARPLYGLAQGRWGVLVDDADWLFKQYALAADRDGWSAADLFGVLPGHDAWGGIADRLRGSRSLVMTADVARWRRMHSGLSDSFARGSGAMPRLTLLWDRVTDTAGEAPHG